MYEIGKEDTSAVSRGGITRMQTCTTSFKQALKSAEKGRKSAKSVNLRYKKAHGGSKK